MLAYKFDSNLQRELELTRKIGRYYSKCSLFHLLRPALRSVSKNIEMALAIKLTGMSLERLSFWNFAELSLQSHNRPKSIEGPEHFHPMDYSK